MHVSAAALNCVYHSAVKLIPEITTEHVTSPTEGGDVTLSKV